MSQYILINHIKVQNANAIAGFTWGFPTITNFLGFTHNLSRKLNQKEKFSDIDLGGCVVISHNHHSHTYTGSNDKTKFNDFYFSFTQNHHPSYLEEDQNFHKVKIPRLIEEGKMNMTVSLLIEYNGDIGNRKDEFLKWITNACYLQRLAGGTILDIKNIELFRLDNETIYRIKRFLLPGFVLMDRADYLQEHYSKQQKKTPDAELFDAWLDFIALKQKARPNNNLISQHFLELSKNDDSNQINEVWSKHLEKPYKQEKIPEELISYFSNNSFDKKLQEQWQNYCKPNEKTDANWEYIPKPQSGYLVPIMTGYKAISKVYKNSDIENTRDSETDVCFVESVHSVGEWVGAHRLTVDTLNCSVWRYDYEDNWYLCKQSSETQSQPVEKSENSDDSY